MRIVSNREFLIQYSHNFLSNIDLSKLEFKSPADLGKIFYNLKDISSMNFNVITIINMSVQPKGRSFTANAGTQAAVLPKAGIPPQTKEPRLQLYQGFNRCESFPFLSAPHSLFSI